MLENLLTAGTFVHIALLFQCAGFMIRDELWLRLLVLIGSGFYVLYYFFFPALPLWDAIYASAILALINLTLIIIIIRERTLFDMNSRETGLFNSFGTLTPGQFRRLIRKGSWRTAKGDVVLTTENIRPEHIYYIVSGKVKATKGKTKFSLEGEKFIGEVGFLMGAPASATVVAPVGTVYVEWKAADLRRLMNKSVPFENAVIALFNYDLARKVADSIGK